MAAGVLAAAAVMGSYGMVLVGLAPLFVVVRARAWRPVLIAAGTAFACVLVFVPFGFWWLSGLSATREAYYALGLDRPYSYFLLGDFSALALVVGPAVAAGLAVTRDRGLWLLLGGAIAALGGRRRQRAVDGRGRAHLAALRPLAPTGRRPGLARSATTTRAWLAVQAACPIVLLVFIRPLW